MEKSCEFENVTPVQHIASKDVSAFGSSTGDYECKKKIGKSDMTIETVTTLINEHICGRLKHPNPSNDGKVMKMFQKRQTERKWLQMSGEEKPKSRPQNQKIKQRDNRCGLCGNPVWTRRYTCPGTTAEYRNCKRRGHYENMCRSLKRTKYAAQSHQKKKQLR